MGWLKGRKISRSRYVILKYGLISSLIKTSSPSEHLINRYIFLKRPPWLLPVSRLLKISETTRNCELNDSKFGVWSALYHLIYTLSSFRFLLKSRSSKADLITSKRQISQILKRNRSTIIKSFNVYLIFNFRLYQQEKLVEYVETNLSWKSINSLNIGILSYFKVVLDIR